MFIKKKYNVYKKKNEKYFIIIKLKYYYTADIYLYNFLIFYLYKFLFWIIIKNGTIIEIYSI